MEKEKTKEQSLIKETFLKWSGLFLVVVASIAIYFIIANADVIFSTISQYIGILKPVVYGCVIAYVLNPLMKVFQNGLLKIARRGERTVSLKREKYLSGVAITASVVSAILIVIVLFILIVPQLLNSIISLADTLPDKANEYYNQLNQSIRNNAFLADKLQDIALNATEYMDEMVNKKLLPWLQSELLPSVNMLAAQFANGVISVLNLLYNLFIGIIVAIYILASKKTFSAQAKKLAYGVFKKSHADTIIYYVEISNKMFSGFIVGKIVDSAIIGVLNFVLMTIMGLPYAMLISVIVGVTNIIPVFGPYIGAIPSALLILLVSPVQALYFLIMIIILQQLDGNIIGPAILGESTGLSAFWVLFSILFFGGLWGIVGMIIGVPLFAVIYRIVSDLVKWRLKEKNLATETEKYRNLKQIQMSENNEPLYILYSEEDMNGKKKEKEQAWSEKVKQMKNICSKFSSRKKSTDKK